jgi:hypothetical protein
MRREAFRTRGLTVCMGIFCAALLALGAGCSDDSSTTVDGGAKDGSGADLYPDLGLPPDLGQKQPCETEWIDALNAQDKVSTGAVNTTENAGVKQTTIDASAGGMNGASKNPFVYISLKDGARVDITDLASKSSKDWDLAFRRSVIRVNGGDSGAGGAGVARIENKTLAEVTAVPAAASFKVDEFIDESCKVTRDPINNPQTAFSGASTADLWYAYDVGTSKLKPQPFVWVVRRADGSFVKLTIDSYYNGSGASGHFTISWSAL